MKYAIVVGMFVVLIATLGCGKNQEPTQAEVLDRISNLDPISHIDEETLLPGQETILKECDAILEALQNSGVKTAFVKIRELSPLPASELDALETTTKQQLDAVEPRFGKIIGYERVSVSLKGQSVIECVYIAKCEKHLLRWRFYFYKPKEKWFLNSFYWDDQIQSL